MLRKLINFKLGIILLVLFNSCEFNKTKFSDNKEYTKDEIDTYISNGQFSKLITHKDTLNFSINLSGYTDSRIDVISFIKIANDIYIRAIIRKYNRQITNNELDYEISFRGEFKKYVVINDSLNFDNLLSKIHKSQLKKVPSNQIWISLGVKNKWGNNYVFNSDSLHFNVIRKQYFEIMNKIYPEIKQFKPLGVTEIVEDSI